MRLSTKKQQTLLTLSVLLGLSSPVYAQDIQNNDVVVTPDVVVTATRTQEEVKAVPQTVEVITKEDIEQEVRAIAGKNGKTRKTGRGKAQADPRRA